MLYLFIALVICEFLLSPFEAVYAGYASFLGYIGLAIEATLPIPQIIANASVQSCKGIRLSVIGSWIIGDSMKMFWFFTSPGTIPMAFKMCGIFQACCDAFLGVQYLMYGEEKPEVVKDHVMEDMTGGDLLGSRLAKVSSTEYGPTPSGRFGVIGEKF